MKAGAHDFLLKDKLARLVPAVERELREAALRSERAAMQQQLLLSDRLVQIGTLAAGVAHEINNPLAYVIGNLVYAIDELSGPASASERPAVLQALKGALEGCERIRATSADLRVFSRSDDGEKQRVEVKRVLESACSLASNQIHQRAKLTKDFQDVPPIAANESRLGQVFLNLLINAAQAIPEGDAAAHEVRVSLRQLDDCVEIDISDTGLGIAAEAREHLFQPFFTTKPKGVGTGLGLSICQKIVRECGGDISAHANPTAGTTFRVRLPIGTLPASAKPPLLSSHPSIRRGRVLVIDDEPGIVDVVTRVLRTEHETVGVVGARAGLELLSRDPGFEVIFCDLMMPDMNGMEFYATLQRSAPQLIERIVFLSGGAFTLEVQQFLACVENLRLQKPFDTKTLRAIVRAQLTRLDARRLLGAIAPARS
jgi:signal transduction histidine kinase/CheY-like chemotaxis protein